MTTERTLPPVTLAQSVVDNFDAWLEHPYTKTLMKSIAEDYVPKADAVQAMALLREARDDLEDRIDAHGYNEHTADIIDRIDALLPREGETT